MARCRIAAAALVDCAAIGQEVALRVEVAADAGSASVQRCVAVRENVQPLTTWLLVLVARKLDASLGLYPFFVALRCADLAKIGIAVQIALTQL